MIEASATAISTLKALLEAVRPRQWIKNILVFAGMFYAGQFGRLDPSLRVTAAFALFCMLSGVAYLVNDIFDLEQDRIHPSKRLRPLASGRLTVHTAWGAATILGVLALGLSFLLSPAFGTCALAYFILMMSYSMALKHIVILDLLTLAIGFVLRALAGALAVGVLTTQWFLECVFFLALFIAICKRRHELVMLNEQATNHRAVLREYSERFLDQMVSASTAAAILSYALWATNPGTEQKFRGMVVTVPFVLYGIFRYLYLVYHKSEGGAPELLFLTDRGMLVNLLLWFLVVMLLIYYQKSAGWIPIPELRWH
jgi:4-hydroxybenzoate polyprenyltransferase